MGTSEQKAVGAALAEIGRIDSTVSSTIDASNAQLANIVDAIKGIGNLHAASKMYVDNKDKELHAIMDAKEALVWGQVNTNKNDIQHLSNSLRNTGMSPSNGGNVPLVMLGTVR